MKNLLETKVFWDVKKLLCLFKSWFKTIEFGEKQKHFIYVYFDNIKTLILDKMWEKYKTKKEMSKKKIWEFGTRFKIEF